MAAVHNWRSAIGQAGITAVDAWFAGDPIKGKPHSGLTTSAARGAWATEMVETTNYIYEHGDGDVSRFSAQIPIISNQHHVTQRKTRRFTSPLVLQVFAYHIGKTVEISKHEDEFLLPMEDYPVGALAMATVAVCSLFH